MLKHFSQRLTQFQQTSNPLIDLNTGLHAFTRAFLPMLGVLELKKAIVNTSAELELSANATLQSLVIVF